MTKTLIIIPSQIRGGSKTFSNFKEYILNINNADLGLFISSDYEHNQYLDHAKYSFFLPEYHDHRQGLINELKFLSYDIPNSLTNKDILLDDYQISCIIHVYYKLFILRMLKENNLLDKYDWFIINRSDLLHGKNIDVSLYNTNFIYIPDGEYYRGLPDRFSIIPRKYIENWLSIYNPFYFSNIKKIKKGKRKISPEIMDKNNLDRNRIPYKLIDYTYISIRDCNEKTRNSMGKFNNELDLYVKYNSEYDLALKNNSEFNINKLK